MIKFILLALVVSVGCAQADEAKRNLDADIESLEQELMSLNGDLLILEEDLLCRKDGMCRIQQKSRRCLRLPG